MDEIRKGRSKRGKHIDFRKTEVTDPPAFGLRRRRIIASVMNQQQLSECW